MQGYWDRDRVTRAVAALHGVELASAATPSEASAGAGPTHDLEALKARARRDVELREQAVQAGIAQLRFLQEKLDADRTRYDQLWAGFQSQLQSLREGAIATGRNNVREIWENIRPKQAKVQIIEMLKEEKGIDEVVSILLLEDSNAEPVAGQVKLRVVHAAPGAPAVDVYVTTPFEALDAKNPVLSNVPFKVSSDYLAVPIQMYQARVAVAGTKTVAIDSHRIATWGGMIRTVVAVDNRGGGAPFDVILLPDRN